MKKPLIWKYTLTTAALLLLGAVQAQARTLYVRAGSSGDGLTWATAKSTVGQALALAVSGDQVWVAGGNYPNTHISIPNGVALYGGFSGTENDLSERPTDPLFNPTTLDGGGSGFVVSVSFTSGNQRVDGFVIRNGRRGVFIDHASPIIANNRVEDNYNGADDGFGNESSGIFALFSSATVTNNIVTRNRSLAGDGGGIHIIFPGSPVVTNNVIFDNHAGRITGGIHFFNVDYAVVQNNRVFNNSSPYGGGLHFNGNRHGSLLLEGNTFTNNSAPSGGSGGGLIVNHVSSTVRNNAFITNVGIAGLEAIGGNNTIQNNLFQGNSGGVIGGLHAAYCTGEISGNTFRSNSGSVAGGCLIQYSTVTFSLNTLTTNSGSDVDGVYTLFSQVSVLYNKVSSHLGIGVSCINNNASIANNLIYQNGTGLSLNSCTSPVINNTIADNSVGGITSVGEGYGVYGNNIVAFNGFGIRTEGTPTLQNNCVANNSTNYQGIIAGATDISSDPLFVARGTGNYRLQGASPAADAGDNSLLVGSWTAFDGSARIQGVRVDMGAYERVGYEGLCALVDAYVSKEGIHNSLCAKLRAAAKAEARGDLTAKANILNAFVNEVNAQTGKAITAVNAQTLISLVSIL